MKGSAIDKYGIVILNSKGSSLVQVMIAAGIMAILAMIMAGMISDQNKQVKAINQKLSLLEIESQMKNMFTNSDFCNCVLRGKTFNTTPGSEAIVAADQITYLRNGYSTGPTDAIPCTEILTNYFIPPVGQKLNASSEMTVQSIAIINMKPQSPAVYSADVEVTVANSIMKMKGIRTGIQFVINPTANLITNRPFLSCGSINIPKTWALYVPNVPPGSLAASSNVSSVTYLAVGRYRVNFSTAMPNTNYAVLLTVDTTAAAPVFETTNKTVNGFDIRTGASPFGPFDFDSVSILVVKD